MKSGFENAIWQSRDQCLSEKDPGEGLAMLNWLYFSEGAIEADSCDPLDEDAIAKAMRKCLRFIYWFGGASVWGDAALAYVSTHKLGILTYNPETRLWKEFDDAQHWIHASPDRVVKAPHPVIVQEAPEQRTGVVWADFKPANQHVTRKFGECQRPWAIPVLTQVQLLLYPRGGFNATDLDSGVNTSDNLFMTPFMSLFSSQVHQSSTGTSDGWLLNYKWKFNRTGAHFAEFCDTRYLGGLSCSVRLTIIFDPER